MENNHVWNQENISKFGNDRCKNCGIQYEYYKRNLSTLNSWSAEDKKDPEWQQKIDSFNICKRDRN